MLMTRFIVCEPSTVGWTQKVVCAPRSTEIDPPLAMRTCYTNEGVVNAPGNYSPRSADIPSVFIFDLHHPYQHPTNATHGCDDAQEVVAHAEPSAEIISHGRLLTCRPPTRADAIKESDPLAFVASASHLKASSVSRPAMNESTTC
jgi:hypothetical protein